MTSNKSPGGQISCAKAFLTLKPWVPWTSCSSTSPSPALASCTRWWLAKQTPSHVADASNTVPEQPQYQLGQVRILRRAQVQAFEGALHANARAACPGSFGQLQWHATRLTQTLQVDTARIGQQRLCRTGVQAWEYALQSLDVLTERKRSLIKQVLHDLVPSHIELRRQIHSGQALATR
ncbi:hypothetical protein GTA26_29105 [Rhodococcus hoagii]|nr:hypothetical protein [Prescottella equi]